MKKVLFIFILLLLAGCAGNETAPAAEAASTVAPTVDPTAAPTPQSEQQITIEAIVTPTAVPPESPTPSPTPEPTPTPSPTPTPGPLDGFIIGLDPGHQLIYDPAKEPVAPGSKETKQKVAGGCRGVVSRVYEYEVNLDVSLLLRDMLEEAGATVVMTHEVLDVNISNVQRAQMFNEANVDLGIRIHCNKSDNSKTAGAFMLVPTENRTKFYEENVRAAQVILKAYCAETGLSMRYKPVWSFR